MKRLTTWLACLLLAGCTSLPLGVLAPKVSVADIGVKSLGLFEQRFDLSLRLTNPNDFDLNIEGLDFELEVNDRPFAKGLASDKTVLPAASSTIMQVEAVTESRNILSQMKTLPFEVLKEGVPYRVKGRVKTDKTDWLPFELKGVYGGESKPKGQRV
jgi:LEA14-like dessication related protein